MVQSISLSAAGSPPDGDPGSAFHAVRLDGYCSVKGSGDIPCSLIGLAYDSGIALSEVEASFTDEVLVAVPHLGLQKGVVSRVLDGGFEFQFSQAAYTKLWAYLDWLKNAAKRAGQEHRNQERIVPIKKLVGLERAGEPRSMARIIDLSRSGVSFTTSKTLSVGEAVNVGGYSGKISRLFEGGAAVQFDDEIAADRFNVMLDLDVA